MTTNTHHTPMLNTSNAARVAADIRRAGRRLVAATERFGAAMTAASEGIRSDEADERDRLRGGRR